MDNADIFSYLVKKKCAPEDSILVRENIDQYDFGFQTVFYKCGPVYCLCRCAYDHEYFSYISDSGDIDVKKFEILVQAVKNGHCPHATIEHNKDYLQETRVNSIQVAAALGLEEMTKIFLSAFALCARHRAKESAIFNLNPYEVAMLKNKEKILSLLQHGLSSKCPPLRPPKIGFLESRFCFYTRETENNILQVEEKLPMEICIEERKYSILKLLLERETYDRESIYELMFKHNATDLIDSILDQEKTEGKTLNRFRGDVYCVAELAVIYHHKIMFEKYFPSLTSGKYLLRELCRCFQANDLLKHISKIENELLTKGRSSASLKDTSLDVFFKLLFKYRLSGDRIKSAMVFIPDIQKRINTPLLQSTHAPLESYISKNNNINVSIAKVFIDLGADIDRTIRCQPLENPYSEYDDEEEYEVHPDELLLLDNEQRYVMKGFDANEQTLLMYIVENEEKYSSGFRPFLELLLYENTSLDLNYSVVHIALENYVRKPGIASNTLTTGTYIVNASLHNDDRALTHTVPLLIEAGFPFCGLAVQDALVNRKYLDQKLNITAEKEIVRHEVVTEYLQRCLSEPRTLKLRCRDVLRKHFPRRQLHEFLSVEEIPKPLKEYLLLKPILKSLPGDI